MGGVQMRMLLRSHMVVIFGATSRIGIATVETLARAHEGAAVVVAVERPKDPRVRRLRRATGCYAVQCDYTNVLSLQRVVRHANAVLLVPALSPSGTQFSKRVVDACVNENVARIVLISSLLATDDYWRQADMSSVGYEAIEAHARALTNNCIALRIPLLMETLLYCRDEVIFASRFLCCFQPTTPVPCIAVRDVALAASELLTKPHSKFHATYSLATANVTCSPVEIERLLSHALGHSIHAKYVDEARFTHLLKEKNVSELAAVNTIRMKSFLELSAGVVTHATLETQPPPSHHGQPQLGDQAKTALPLTRVGYSTDFRTLAKRELMSPCQWVVANRAMFERSTENEMQLFVMGSGEGLFQEIERLVAQQVTAPLAAAGPGVEGETNYNDDDDDEMNQVGEAAIPTATGSAVHSKATFCTIKTVPGGRQRQQAQLRVGHQSSPMTQLLAQLTPADVVVFVPPLRFGAAECMEVLRVVVDAVRRAKAWGIVMVSSIFTGRGWADTVNSMGEMEQFVENAGVPYTVVRLPLFMEYFLALSQEPAPPELEAGASTTEEEKQPELEPSSIVADRRPLAASSGTSSSASWPLLGRELASTPQYLISTADAAKALVAIAYTFPLHRRKIRNVYTERRTMQEIEQCFQQHAYKGRGVDFARVDALKETPRHEFWRVAYWTKSHVKQFLETEVQLSGERTAPLAMDETFQEITECPPITLDKWAARHAKSLSHALSGGASQRKRKGIAAAKPQERETTEAERPKLERSAGEMELKPVKEEEKGDPQPRPMQMTATASS